MKREERCVEALCEIFRRLSTPVKLFEALFLQMKSTDNELYSVKPVYAFLNKDDVVDIELTRIDGGNAKADKIFLLYTPVCGLLASKWTVEPSGEGRKGVRSAR